MNSAEMPPGRILSVIGRRKWAFAFQAALVLLIALVTALTLKPVYRSSATILIEQQDIPPEFIKTTVTTYAEQQLQIIRQRIMTSTRLLEIINRYGLYQDLKDDETTEEIIARMREDITLNPISVDVVDPKTGRPVSATIAFTLSYQGENSPAKIQQIAGVLTSLYLEENVRTRGRQASDISRFLEEEMTRVKGDLALAEKRLAGFKEVHVNELPELLQVNMQSLNNLDQNRQILNERMVSLKRQEASIETQLAAVTPPSRDREHLDELRLGLLRLNNQYSGEHPDVVSTRAEIAQLEKRIREKPTGKDAPGDQRDNAAYVNLTSQLSGTRSELLAIESQLHELEDQMADYRSRISTTPKVEAQYSALLSERNNTQAKHDDLMRKLMEARSSESLENGQKGERFTLIEPALLPEKPFKPNRYAIIMIGMVLAVGLGLTSGALTEFTDSSVRDENDLMHLNRDVPVIAIPRIITDEDLKRKRRRRIIYLGSACGSVMATALVFHLFVMKLDVLWTVLILRLTP